MEIKSYPKTKYENKKYLAFVRKHPCSVYGCPGRDIEAHHVPLGQAGKGIKAPDTHAIPLCFSHHREHDGIGQKTFYDKYNLFPERIIIRLLTEYLEGLKK